MTAGAAGLDEAPVLSLDAVVEAHYGLVFRTGLAISGNLHDAEDICQEAFLAIGQGIAGFRGEARLETWLYRITLRVGIRWLARNRSGTARPGAEEPQAPAAGLPVELIQALNRLPLNSRSVLLLVAVEGFTHAEAGKALGVPEGTIASRLHTARRQLAEQLELGAVRQCGALTASLHR